MAQDLKYWVAFNHVPNLGAVRYRALESHFPDLEHAWRAPFGELRAAGLDESVARTIVTHRDSISPDGVMEKLEKCGGYALNWHDPQYPAKLAEIYDPSPVLYVRGSLEASDERSLAVVGTRKATAYGKEAASILCRDLASNGVAVISGLARGIDSIAHRAAIDAGGRTIAVLGTGVDTIYPPEHSMLARDIIEHGALVSEYPLGTSPKAQHFPQRNRLISGMTLGTLVIEAGDRSGALITVSHALEQGRDVFCVPGNIFSPASRGTNALIQEGAKAVVSYTDILEELNLNAVAFQMEMRGLAQPDNEDEARILGHVTHEPLHIDELGRLSDLPIHMVTSVLAMMELKGLVKQVGGMHYTRVSEVARQYGN